MTHEWMNYLINENGSMTSQPFRKQWGIGPCLMNEWMNEWMNELINEWMHECECMNAWMHE